MRKQFARLVALLVAGSALLGACGGGEPNAAAAEVKPLGADAMPTELLGLTVAAEPVSNLKEVKRPFVEALGLYSLRQGDQLQATLQISRFTEQSDVRDTGFQQAVVGQIGSTVPRPFRMGEQSIYLTTARRQVIGVWFKDRTLFVLATREEFDTPRALLRAALEINA